MLENTIDALIITGWRFLDVGFNDRAFQEWKKQAIVCLVARCGESHPYTECFSNSVEKERTSSVLTGVGLLTAAQSRED